MINDLEKAPIPSQYANVPHGGSMSAVPPVVFMSTVAAPIPFETPNDNHSANLYQGYAPQEAIIKRESYPQSGSRSPNVTGSATLQLDDSVPIPDLMPEFRDLLDFDIITTDISLDDFFGCSVNPKVAGYA